MPNQLSPFAVDAYSRFMMELFDERQIISVPTGFQSFFGSSETASKTLFSPDANDVDIDIIRGNERLAALVQRGVPTRIIAGQKNTDEQKSSSFSRSYPLIKEEGDVSADQLNYRVAGENPYAAMEKLDRLRIFALNNHLEHIRRIVRTFEYLATQSILTGKMPALLGTTNDDLIYDFRRKSTHIFTPPIKWDQSTAVILANIDAACKLIRSDAHINPDMMILGAGAMDAFLSNETLQKQADNRRFELINVSMNNPVPPQFDRFVKSGFTPRGRLRTPGGYELWMFTYTDIYTNSAGSTTVYMPDDQVLICSSQARCDRYFGPQDVLPMTASRDAWYQEMFGFSSMVSPMPPNIKNMDNIINPAMFYCDAYTTPDHTKVSIRTQAAPIFAPIQTDAFVTMTALLTP